MMEVVSPFKDAIDAIKQAGGEAFKYCYQCGLCDTVCPWNRVRKFSIRNIVRQATFGLPEIEGEDIWRCTTCGNCPLRCPRGVKQIEVGVSIRRIASEYGVVPDPIHTVSASLGAEGNPMGERRDKRADWAAGLSVKTFTEGTEILYFPCCYSSYDSRLKRTAVATANILNRAGVDFGILGSRDSCCGESVRKAGDEVLFKRLARENIKSFVENGVQKILVSSPHCYHTFKNEYSQFKVNFEVVHISQYLSELVVSGRIKLTGQYPKKVAYHDPCYLGRHNGLYDQPRDVLKRATGRDVIEMEDSRDSSLCCGGGGGGIWMDRKKGERFSDIRIQQAVNAGAEVLATACPYCIVNFEDSRLTLPGGEAIEIRDITEIVQEAL
jgi:Fe-S oxidoreductase